VTVVVELRGVSKGFAGRDGVFQPVLRDVDLQVAGGEVLYLTGPSGCGKSTLLNLVAGLHLPDSGQVVVTGVAVHSLGETGRDRLRAREIGYVFQTFNLLSALTALENLTVPLSLAGEAPRQAEARAVLEKLGMGPHLGKRPFELSVGQRQRVAVARALLREPAVLLADEPTANLDPASAGAVTEALAGLRDAGAALVVATHDPALREALPGASLDIAEQEAAP